MLRTALTLAALFLALFLGRLSASATGPSPTAAPERSPGYAHSRAGAALAAAGYQQSFVNPRMLRPGALRRQIEAVATPDFVEAMVAANAPGTARLAAGPIGTGIRHGIRTAYFAVPIGYRLLSYTPERARVLTWGFTVLGNASAVEPSAYFGTARTDLLWRGGRWQISYTRAAYGPTPRLATPRKGGEGFDVVDLLNGLDFYGVAP